MEDKTFYSFYCASDYIGNLKDAGDYSFKIIIDDNKGENRMDIYLGSALRSVPKDVFVSLDLSQSKTKKINEKAFSDCHTLKSIILPEGLEEIEESAFWNCTSLKTLNVPPSVKRLGVFANEKSQYKPGDVFLENVILHSGSLTKIEDNTFRNCTSLKVINIPSSVKSIGERAFYECYSLENVELSEGLEEIGELSFAHCTSLKSIEIPETVTGIGRASFEGCNKLEGKFFKKIHLWEVSEEKGSKVLDTKYLYSVKYEEMSIFYWHRVD